MPCEKCHKEVDKFCMYDDYCSACCSTCVICCQQRRPYEINIKKGKFIVCANCETCNECGHTFSIAELKKLKERSICIDCQKNY